MTMRRSAYEELIRKAPGLRPLLHVCAGCRAFGVKPGILETHRGDYGSRVADANYPELRLNEQGLCDRFATTISS